MIAKMRGSSLEIFNGTYQMRLGGGRKDASNAAITEVKSNFVVALTSNDKGDDEEEKR